jgi:cytochrome c peroxidase
MRPLKLIIVGIFVVFFAAFAGGRLFSPVVSGQSGLTAPTGVTATDGNYANKIGIYWNPVRGATQYRVFRNVSNDAASAQSVGVTPAAFFFDPTAVIGQQYFYWVRAENSSVIGEVSTSDAGLRAQGSVQDLGPIEPPEAAPPGNPLTAAKATLGKILFWDEQMSSTRTVSCGTCHRPAAGGADPRTIPNNIASTNPGPDGIFNNADDIGGSPGVPLNNGLGVLNWSNSYGLQDQVTGRKAPSYINAVYSPNLFWDGRANGVYRDPLTNSIILNGGGALESQSSGPPVSDAEMGHTGRNWSQVAAQLAVSKPLALSPSVPEWLVTWIGGRTYPALFEEAFGTPEVTPSRISLAIGTFERTLFSDQAPIQLADSGITPLTPAEQRGRGVFNNNQCANCHIGNRMTDDAFHNIGVRPQADDPGRFTVTGNANNLGEFRTPNLLNVALRGPYMHNGRLATLADVVEFYNRGGDFTTAANFNRNLIRPRNLTAQQKADLVEFLGRPLTDPRVANESGPFERPALYTESDRVPVITGTGTAGSGAKVPKAVAVQPPLAGNPQFTVAVYDALGGASGVLVINDTDPGNTPSIPASGSFARRDVQLEGNGAGAGYTSVSFQIPDDPAMVGRTFFGRWYINDAGSSTGVAVSQAFRFTVFGATTAAPPRSRADFDGDGRTDISVYRPTDNNWYVFRSAGGVSVTNWGAAGDALTPGDFDGDGKADQAVYRPSSGQWYVFRSSDSAVTIASFGTSGDVPVAGDYDGDGKTDLAQFRPSDGYWYIYRSTDSSVSIINWGGSGDVPVPADFDADGKSDAAIYRPASGTWYVYRSTAGPLVAAWGISGDRPVQADYDGDDKADLAVFRPADGNWYVFRSSDSQVAITNWGGATDVPTPGDFDGDGKDDPAIFRNGTWYVYRSTVGPLVATWGVTGDIPIPSRYIPE